MGSTENGIKQSPFSDAWATPDVGGQGINGTGGGIDTSGTDGIINSPFSQAIVPTPSGACTPVAEFGGTPPYTATTTDAPAAGSQAPWDITTSRNTVDRK